MKLPLLEHYLPQWEFAEKHSHVLTGSPVELYRKLVQTDFTQSRLLNLLFWLRGLKTKNFYELRKGFTTLSEEPLILGMIGKPWRLKPLILVLPSEEFISFDEPGFAKIVWNFTFEDQGEGKTLVSTETRIHCTDRSAYRKFRVYWFFVRPFSNWVRREMLKIIGHQ